MSSIHYLAGRGDVYELHALLEGGADPNERALNDGKTPLMKAAKANNRVAVKLLLKYGADLDAVDNGDRTALLEASDLEMKRLLLDAGADPDRGRISGMTLMAFFASFLDREMVELFLGHGADTEEKTRGGRSVRDLLDDPTTPWRLDTWATPDSAEIRARHADAVRKLSENLAVLPEEYVARHRDIIIFGYHAYTYDDPAVEAWAKRVGELLRSPELREEAYQRHLEGEELADALRKLDKEKGRAERKRLREERLAEFEAAYLRC